MLRRRERDHLHLLSHWRAWVQKPTKKSEIQDRKRWEHAKFVLKACMGTGVTLRDHLLWTHWIVSNTASIAVRTYLERDHPVRRLMHIFVFRSASVNLASSKTLMPEFLYVHRSCALEYNELLRSLHDLTRAWRYETFPGFVEAKRLGDLEGELPLVQDGLSYWNRLQGFVQAFLGLYYRSSDDVAGDPELVEFWHAVDRMPPGPPGEPTGPDGVVPGYGYKLPELCSGKGAMQNLTDYLCHVIFWCTANHELVGAVIEYFTTPAGLSTKIWDESLPENGLEPGGQFMADVQTYMQDLSIISTTGYRQPPLISDWARLLHIRQEDAEQWCHLKDGQYWRRLELTPDQVDIAESYMCDLYQKSSALLTVDFRRDFLGYNGCVRGKRRQAHWVAPKEKAERLEGEVREVLDDLLYIEDRDFATRVETHNLLLNFIHRAFIESLLSLSFEIDARNNTDSAGVSKQHRHPVHLHGSGTQAPAPEGATSPSRLSSFMGVGHKFEAFNPANLECSVSI